MILASTFSFLFPGQLKTKTNYSGEICQFHYPDIVVLLIGSYAATFYMLLNSHQQLQQVAYKSPLAHKVVDERVDRTVALENGKLRIGKDVFLFLKKLYNLIMGASDSFWKLL